MYNKIFDKENKIKACTTYYHCRYKVQNIMNKLCNSKDSCQYQTPVKYRGKK
jgi:hypothetical protein